MLGRGRGSGPGSRGDGAAPSAGFPPVRVAAGAGREPGASAVQTRLAGGRGHVWAGADIDPQPPSRDAVFQHYYSQLYHVVKVRPALPPLPGPLPGVGGRTDIGLPTEPVPKLRKKPSSSNPCLLQPQVLGVFL